LLAVLPLGIIGFYRYLWYIIRFAAYLAYRPIPIPEHPTYRAEEDVTVRIILFLPEHIAKC
jgi:hypothetical protein